MPVQPEPGCGAVEFGDINAIGCCAPSVTSSTLCTPTGPIAVVVATPCGDCEADAGSPAVVGWVDLASGVFTPGAPPSDAEPCTSVPPEIDCATVSTVTLCDLPGGGECTRFLRHLVLDCDGSVTVAADTTLAGTPYTPVGEVVDCSECPADQTRLLELCDQQGDGTAVTFLRWLTVNSDGEVTGQRDTELDGVTEYPPTGVVGACDQTAEPCVPVPMCARLTSITGPGDWLAPDGIESVSLHVTAGPVTVIDCAGEETALPDGCGTLSWSAPGTSCVPGTLCGPFVVIVPAESTVLVNWLEPCEETSP